ncbi:hypothetical protein NMY22_g1973 [Coprinellus aureogranulatus]|nr:hypothetical protein NMY22_g1973 [Coprinellus aureogranulatus]
MSGLEGVGEAGVLKDSTETSTNGVPPLSFQVVKASPGFSLASAVRRAVEDEDLKAANEDERAEGFEQGGAVTSTNEGVAGGLSGKNDSASTLESPTPQALKRKLNETTACSSRRRAFKKLRKADTRKQKRQTAFESSAEKAPAPKAIEAIRAAAAVQVPLTIEDLPSNASGYEAKFGEAGEGWTPSMQELLEDGYETIKWGWPPLILADSSTERVFFMGMPKAQNDPTYAASCDEATKLLVELSESSSFGGEEFSTKRGEGFAPVNFGIGAGHGPPEPYNLRKCADQHPEVINALRQSPALKRLACHQSATLHLCMPRLYAHYHSHTIPVRKHLPDLVPNWDSSIFSAAACNLGKRVATCLHRDCRNLSYGFCAVHALGKFDHTKGGHIVLKEPKLIVQFPPGTHILLPSAVITHGNIPVQDGETRVSFTQYTAGAMFRYADCGFTTLKKLKKRNKRLHRKILADSKSRWQMGLGLWPTVDELLRNGTTDGKILKEAGREQSLYQFGLELVQTSGPSINPTVERLGVIAVDMGTYFAECVSAAQKAGMHVSSASGPLRPFFFRLCKLLHVPAVFVFVFDGPERPAVKRGTQVQSDRPLWWVDTAKDLIQAFGFHVHQAPGEAEAELAMLNRWGIVDAVITRDSDALVFGATRVLKTLTKKGEEWGQTTFLRAASSCSPLWLVVITTPGLPGCGGAAAVELARSGVGDGLFTHLHAASSDTSRQMRLDGWKERTRRAIVGNAIQPPLSARLRTSILNGLPQFPSLETVNKYVNPATSALFPTYSPNSQAWRSSIIDQPDALAIINFCRTRLDWSNSAVLLEVLRRNLWEGLVLRRMYSEHCIWDEKDATFGTSAHILDIQWCRLKKRRSSAMAGEEYGRLQVLESDVLDVLVGGKAFSGVAIASDRVVEVWVPVLLLPGWVAKVGEKRIRPRGGQIQKGRYEEKGKAKGKGKAVEKKTKAKASTPPTSQPSSSYTSTSGFIEISSDDDEPDPGAIEVSSDNDDGSEVGEVESDGESETIVIDIPSDDEDSEARPVEGASGRREGSAGVVDISSDEEERGIAGVGLGRDKPKGAKRPRDVESAGGPLKRREGPTGTVIDLT